jgi:hypothetical protein
MGVSGQRHAPAALYPRKRKTQPIGLESEWASELVGHRLDEKFLACSGDQTPAVQSVLRHYNH